MDYDEVDSELVVTSETDGKKYYPFTLSYRMKNGKEWGLDLYATGWDEARERVAAIRETLELDGLVCSRIPHSGQEHLQD